MLLSAKLFVIKKFQRIQTRNSVFQAFLQALRSDLLQNNVSVRRCESDKIFNSGIEVLMTDHDATLQHWKDLIDEIEQFILNNKQYQEIYGQITSYCENITVSQPYLTKLLNGMDIFPEKLQFLDLRGLFNCSLVNSILFLHSCKSHVIHHLEADAKLLKKIYHHEVNELHLKRFGDRLRGVASICLNLYSIASEGKRFIMYLHANGIDKQLKKFTMFNLKQPFKSNRTYETSPNSTILDLKNCETVYLMSIGIHISITISSKCQVLALEGEFDMMQQLPSGDFSGLEILCLMNFKMINGDSSDCNVYKHVKLKDLILFKMNPATKSAIQFFADYQC